MITLRIVHSRKGNDHRRRLNAILQVATNRTQLIEHLGPPYQEYPTLETNPFRVLLPGMIDTEIAEQCTCLMFKRSDMIYLIFVDSNSLVRASMVTNN